MSNLAKKDPAYELIKEMINGVLFERGVSDFYKKSGGLRASAQKVIDITDLSSITDLPISELGWTKIMTPEEGGEINEVGDNQRRQLEEYLTHIEGATLKEKIEYINSMFNMSPEQIESSDMFGTNQSEKIQKVLAYLVFMKTLTTIITNFNASAAGFVFEAFLGVLLGGQQVPANTGTIADLYGGDGSPLSLKLYGEKGVHVGGSFDALVGDMINPKSPGKDFIQYVVAIKSLQGKGLSLAGNITIYEFKINRNNIFRVLGSTGSGDSLECIQIPKDFIANPRERGAKKYTSHIFAPGEMLKTFINILKSNLKLATTPQTGKIAKMLEKYLRDADNDPEYMFGVKKSQTAKVGYGYTKLNQKNCEEFILNVNSQQNMFDPKQDKIAFQEMKKILFTSIQQTIQERSKIETDAFKMLNKVEWEENAEVLMDFYDSLSDKEKKQALLNTKGYLTTLQFGMTGKMMTNIIESIPEAEGSLIGTIVVGRNNVVEVIKKMALILGQNVVEIFNNLKTLNTSLNTYFATGLTDDQAAEQAQQSATKINRKTTELRKKGI